MITDPDLLVKDVGQKKSISAPGKTVRTNTKSVTTVANRDMSDGTTKQPQTKRVTDRVHHRSPNEPSSPPPNTAPCQGCGAKGIMMHPRKDCPAADRICNRCNTKGHNERGFQNASNTRIRT